jgi:hypothetical protein
MTTKEKKKEKKNDWMIEREKEVEKSGESLGNVCLRGPPLSDNEKRPPSVGNGNVGGCIGRTERIEIATTTATTTTKRKKVRYPKGCSLLACLPAAHLFAIWLARSHYLRTE